MIKLEVNLVRYTYWPSFLFPFLSTNNNKANVQASWPNICYMATRTFFFLLLFCSGGQSGPRICFILPARRTSSMIIINKYLPKAKLILLNNRRGDYSTILTEPEVNNCCSIFTRSDLNRVRKETIKKQLVWLTGEFMREHEAINSGCAKVRSLQYLQTWQMIVLILLYRVL